MSQVPFAKKKEKKRKEKKKDTRTVPKQMNSNLCKLCKLHPMTCRNAADVATLKLRSAWITQ